MAESGTADMTHARTMIVVPTLGSRPVLLERCLHSIAAQQVDIDIVIVAPVNSPEVQRLREQFGAILIPDPGNLPAAINAGVAAAGDGTEFVNWIGDDDLLEPDSVRRSVAVLDRLPDAVLTYGACRYIDSQGRQLWISRAGKWAPRILKWGPDLIPQPGMLMRRSAWERVGGVDESMRFAFDLDLLLKLQPLGSFVDIGQVVSSFRWHDDSLTVGDRSTSLRESEVARRRALTPFARRVAWMWERPVRGATRMAAWELQRRARRMIESQHG